MLTLRLLLLQMLLTVACSCQPLPGPPGARDVTLPDRQPVELTAIGRLDFGPLGESSGIVRSRTRSDVYFTHNDSGDKARLFAVHRDGSLVLPRGQDSAAGYEGILVDGANNVDWEDIAQNDRGQLIIADSGNNQNDRRDLALYLVPEPDLLSTASIQTVARYPFSYPEQKAFPPPDSELNFDAEAVFFALGKTYLLTKHRGDTGTRLYRMDDPKPEGANVLVWVDAFNSRGKVTGADATPDGSRIAVLTYEAIWVFTAATSNGDDWLQGGVKWLPIRAEQCEAIAWDGEERLLITNEQRGVFSVEVSDLISVL